MNKSKVMGPLILVLWAMLIINIAIIELMNVDLTILVVTAYLVLGCLIAVHAWFLYTYIKNHKRVLSLQDQYVETLKPDKPLRFCPTDEELMKKYLGNGRTIDVVQIEEQTEEIKQQITNDDSLELEMN